MATSLKQDRRAGRFTSPLGTDVLTAVRFDGVEGLSELFDFTIEVVAEPKPLDFNAAIGQECTLTLESIQAPARHFSGVLTEAVWLGVRDDLYAYRLTLRPFLWLLSRAADCRIFHDMSAPEIVEDVLSTHGLSDFELKLSETYPKREYCVQYRESDLAFVCRLMEEEGIYFFFSHEEGKHSLIMVDSKSAHSDVPGLSKVFYTSRLQSGRTDKESFFEIISQRRLESGRYTLNDYNFLRPTAKMMSEYENTGEHKHGSMEQYDYPGLYMDKNEGDRLVRVRLEAEKASDNRRHAVGDAVPLLPGGLVRLEEHPEDSENIRYLVVRCVHSFQAQSYRSTATPDEGEAYSGTYELQPADQPYRASPMTPKPRVLGPQTAKVVGKEGEEIDVDEYGRILVHFHWDRARKFSRRVRVAQTWSGPKWGSIVIPRIGQEVVVEHLEGDPDRPLVTGTVYNADRMPPYELPSNKTKAGVKSNSTKGGGGYNEFVFEDKKGEEQIGLHAQKDLDVVVLNSETRKIGDEFGTAEGDASRATTLVNGDDNLTLEKGSQVVDVATDQTTTIGQNQTNEIGQNQTTEIGQNQTTEVGQNSTLEAGQNVVIEAGQSIELKVGSNKIQITAAGIKIDSTATVTVKSGAIMKIESGAILEQAATVIKLN